MMKTSPLKLLATHGLTAAMAVAFAGWWFGAGGQASVPESDTEASPATTRPAVRGETERPAETVELPPALPDDEPGRDVAAPPIVPEQVLKDASAEEQVNIRVYANVNRSVVNITTEIGGFGLFGDEPSSTGSGSGFVLDREGLILTNFHVIEGARTVQVTLFDGASHEAEPVGLDPSTDVALMRIQVPPTGSTRSRWVTRLPWSSASACWPSATPSAWSAP